MKTISDRTRWTLGTCVVASLLAGCGGPSAQNALPGAMERNAPNSVAPDGWGGGHKGSWMAPQAKHDNLVYVSDTAANAVSVYAWKTHKLVGMLGGINQPFGLCSDQSGDVWIISWGKNQISEYAHAGTKLLKTLAVRDPDANLYDCSVDPTTGNLAVTNWGYVWYKGDVLIFTHATGNAKAYTGPGLWYYYSCSYDNKGNLFADGWDAYLDDVFALAELPKGGGTFTSISLLPNFNPPLIGGIRWDGKYVAIADLGWVYKYSVAGNYAYGKGWVPLTSRWPVGLFWIGSVEGEQKILAPDHGDDRVAVQYWSYPAGGTPTATITGHLNEPFGVTVSKATPWSDRQQSNALTRTRSR